MPKDVGKEIKTSQLGMKREKQVGIEKMPASNSKSKPLPPISQGQTKRKNHKTKMSKRDMMINSAIKIQSVVRMFLSHGKVLDRIEQVQEDLILRAVILLQTVIRRLIAKKLLARVKKQKVKAHKIKCQLCAITIQKYIRAAIAKKKTMLLKFAHLTRSQEQKEFALMEENDYESKIESCLYNHSLREKDRATKRLHQKSSKKIQSRYRLFRFRKAMMARRLKIILVQSIIRGFLARRRYYVSKTVRDFNKFTSNSVKIQAKYRCYHARKKFIPILAKYRKKQAHKKRLEDYANSEEGKARARRQKRIEEGLIQQKQRQFAAQEKRRKNAEAAQGLNRKFNSDLKMSLMSQASSGSDVLPDISAPLESRTDAVTITSETGLKTVSADISRAKISGNVKENKSNNIEKVSDLSDEEFRYLESLVADLEQRMLKIHETMQIQELQLRDNQCVSDHASSSSVHSSEPHLQFFMLQEPLVTPLLAPLHSSQNSLPRDMNDFHTNIKIQIQTDHDRFKSQRVLEEEYKHKHIQAHDTSPRQGLLNLSQGGDEKSRDSRLSQAHANLLRVQSVLERRGERQEQGFSIGSHSIHPSMSSPNASPSTVGVSPAAVLPPLSPRHLDETRLHDVLNAANFRINQLLSVGTEGVPSYRPSTPPLTSELFFPVVQKSPTYIPTTSQSHTYILQPQYGSQYGSNFNLDLHSLVEESDRGRGIGPERARRRSASKDRNSSSSPTAYRSENASPSDRKELSGSQHSPTTKKKVEIRPFYTGIGKADEHRAHVATEFSITKSSTENSPNRLVHTGSNESFSNHKRNHLKHRVLKASDSNKVSGAVSAAPYRDYVEEPSIARQPQSVRSSQQTEQIELLSDEKSRVYRMNDYTNRSVVMGSTASALERETRAIALHISRRDEVRKVEKAKLLLEEKRELVELEKRRVLDVQARLKRKKENFRKDRLYREQDLKVERSKRRALEKQLAEISANKSVLEKEEGDVDSDSNVLMKTLNTSILKDKAKSSKKKVERIRHRAILQEVTDGQVSNGSLSASSPKSKQIQKSRNGLMSHHGRVSESSVRSASEPQHVLRGGTQHELDRQAQEFSATDKLILQSINRSYITLPLIDSLSFSVYWIP